MTGYQKRKAKAEGLTFSVVDAVILINDTLKMEAFVFCAEFRRSVDTEIFLAYYPRIVLYLFSFPSRLLFAMGLRAWLTPPSADSLHQVRTTTTLCTGRAWLLSQ
jgi:hypothetical protein